MKIFTFILAILFLSCTPPVVFDKPYPSDEKDLSFIPNYFNGVYICESDSSLVFISESSITLHKTHYFETKLKYAEERKNCKIVDDKMYVTGRMECIPISVLNDSMIRGTYKETDTLFVLQEYSVARLYNGHLVLSQEFKKGKWTVSLLTPTSGDDLIFKAITKKSVIKNVEMVTHTTDITSVRDKSPRYKVNPTMKEFDALIADEKVFIECEYLTRVQLDELILN